VGESGGSVFGGLLLKKAEGAEGGVDRVGHLHLLLDVGLGGCIHDDEEGEHQSDEVGVGDQPAFVVDVGFGFAGLHGLSIGELAWIVLRLGGDGGTPSERRASTVCLYNHHFHIRWCCIHRLRPQDFGDLRYMLAR
jgi:hypothetical protein